jgi:hypothetical protein
MPQPYHLRYVYPKRSRCPACQSREWSSAGRSGATEYRRCQACRKTYKVRALAEEIEAGLPTSCLQPVS